MSQLYYLDYISKSNLNGTREEIQQEVEKILRVAQRRNMEINVTGALLYSGGHFCQVIEGDLHDIENLIESIQLDPRHRETIILHFETIPRRNFSEWAMAYAGVEEVMRLEIQGILDSKDNMALKGPADTLVSVLDKILREQQSHSNDERPDSA